ncbi:hypothetical protein M3P36_05595 [Altererythrobacter sp. KTW20L]|uniref:hypothetical protein n=1 Tax=Altererythrobacter sp. KTW20L TaxID=2942210 RepID=UPI0020BE1068|nr:hypothetical protein [Altererythrobacter sp. KTW20L]MCL6250518.1 hypothetical protein [Altererythrobacter sp. KTW20L]
MNKMVKILRMLVIPPLLVAAAAALPAPALAEGFVNTRAGWIALSAEAKAAYVQGLNDSLNYFFVDDSLTEALAKRGRTRCLVEQRITAAVLSAQITAAYDEPQFNRFSPVAVYILKIGELCRPYINRERAEFGLGPQ